MRAREFYLISAQNNLGPFASLYRHTIHAFVASYGFMEGSQSEIRDGGCPELISCESGTCRDIAWHAQPLAADCSGVGLQYGARWQERKAAMISVRWVQTALLRANPKRLRVSSR